MRTGYVHILTKLEAKLQAYTIEGLDFVLKWSYFVVLSVAVEG